MKRIAVLISSVLLVTGLSLAQTPQKKEDKSAKKETKTEMATTKVVHNCNPKGTTCVCGDNCKPGCCVTVSDTKNPDTKGKKDTTVKQGTSKTKQTKDATPPK